MAVYTHISREELDLFTDHYSIENILGFSGIKGGTSNSNYLLKTLEKNYILTIFEERTNQDNITNNHLQYAVTWFLLSFVIMIMYIYYIRQKVQKNEV